MVSWRRLKQTKTLKTTKRAAYVHTETPPRPTFRIATTEWKTNTKLALFWHFSGTCRPLFFPKSPAKMQNQHFSGTYPPGGGCLTLCFVEKREFSNFNRRAFMPPHQCGRTAPHFRVGKEPAKTSTKRNLHRPIAANLDSSEFQ